MKSLKIFLLIPFLFVSILIHAQLKPVSLQDCIDEAFKKNVALNQVELTAKLNQVTLKQSKAMLFPNLFFTDDQTFSFGNNYDQVSQQYTSQNVVSNNASLTSNVILFNGFQEVNTIKQNQYLYDAGTLDVEKMKNDITLNIMIAYLQILYAYEAIDIAKSQLSTDSIQLDKTQKLLNGGKLTELSLLQVQSQTANDKAAEINAKNQLQNAKVTLMQIMELPIDTNFDVVHNNMSEPNPEILVSVDDIYKTAEGIKPEIKSAAMRTDAAEIGLDIAKGYDYPKLGLSGTIQTGYASNRYDINYTTTTQLQNIGYLQSNPNETVVGLVPVTTVEKNSQSIGSQFQNHLSEAIGLSLTVPIFNNYQGKYGIEKARINIEYSKLNEQATKNTLRKNIEQAYTDLTSSVKNYLALKEAYDYEERAFHDMEKKFNSGLASTTDLLFEKNNFTRASFSLLQAKFDYIFKTKTVDFYLGKPINL